MCAESLNAEHISPLLSLYRISISTHYIACRNEAGPNCKWEERRAQKSNEQEQAGERERERNYKTHNIFSIIHINPNNGKRRKAEQCARHKRHSMP